MSKNDQATCQKYYNVEGLDEGFAPQDISQDIRLDHVEADVLTIYEQIYFHKDDDSIHARDHKHD